MTDQPLSSRSESTGSDPTTCGVAFALVSSTLASMLLRSANTRWTALTVAVLLHVALIVRLRRGASLAIGVVVVAVALLLATGVAVAPQRSKDLWSYATDGSMVVRHHLSPYTHRPRDVPTDAFAKRVSPGWRSAREVYGPVFHGISIAGAHLYGQSPLAARLFFQCLAALSAALVLLLLWRTTHEPAAIAVLGLCPAFQVIVVHDGHNDVLVGALVLLVVVLLRGRALRAVAVVPLLAVGLMKLPALSFAAVIVAWSWSRRGVRAAMTTAATVAVGMLFGYLAVGGAVAIRPTIDASRLRSSMTMWVMLAHLTGGDARWTSRAAPLLVIVGILILLVARHKDHDPTTAVVCVGLVFVLGAAYALPWYYAWVLPAAALVWRSRTGAAAFLLVNTYAVAYGTGHPLQFGFMTQSWARAGRAIWSATELAAFVVLIGVASARALRRARVASGG